HLKVSTEVVQAVGRLPIFDDVFAGCFNRSIDIGRHALPPADGIRTKVPNAGGRHWFSDFTVCPRNPKDGTARALGRRAAVSNFSASGFTALQVSTPIARFAFAPKIEMRFPIDLSNVQHCDTKADCNGAVSHDRRRYPTAMRRSNCFAPRFNV